MVESKPQSPLPPVAVDAPAKPLRQGLPQESPQDSPVPAEAKPLPAKPARKPEIGGPKGPEPTRYGDWEKAGRCIDF